MTADLAGQRPLDTAGLLADAQAMSALRHVASLVRRAHEGALQGATHEAALVAAVTGDRSVVIGASTLLEALRPSGAVVGDQDQLRPRFELFNARGLITFVPHAQAQRDVVYLGQDSVALLRLAWQLHPGGARALEIGSGTGLLTAALMSRFDHVVAIEHELRLAAATAITVALNRPPTKRADVLVADVAAPVRGGTCDLVVGNPPWVPSNPDRPEARYADGGASGIELPARFAVDAARLLAPGGLAIVLLLDLEWADGATPARALLDDLRQDGHDVSLRPVPGPPINDKLAAQAADPADELVGGHLAALLIRAPSR